MGVIFAADTVTDYAVAAAVFYTSVILIATRFLSVRTVVGLAATSGLLTILSFDLTRHGAYKVGLVNMAISIVAIAGTTYLGLRLKSAELSAHQSRERLLRMARLTTLGQLTTSIAHEVGQPLAAISTSAGACSRWLAQEPPNIERAKAALERIVSDTSRARDILGRVRGLARGEAPFKTSFDFNQAVGEIVELSRGDIDRRGTELAMAFSEGLPIAFADRVQIQQVVGNLLLNAIDAVAIRADGAGKIRLATERTEIGTIRFTIEDNGPGIPTNARQHLFDAFWTTKSGGFGLGLTISRTIIEANGGRIWIPATSDGACFAFEIPAGASQ
ncbi:MAG: GHKL domain-containing protein [Rhizobiales bacterium]|nr:GHKL domain-containing protein [Hyphomicrobiales bacterium]